jgi:MFS family permease
MLRKRLLGENAVKTNVALISAVLVVNAFIWYFVIFNFLKNLVTQPGFPFDSVAVFGINFLGIAFSAISSTFVLRKIKSKLTFLRNWIIAGILLSFAPLVMANASYAILLFISCLVGVYFGLGMPIVMGYYADSNAVEKRGKSSGLAFLAIGVGIFGFSFLGGTSGAITAIILSIWRLMGLVPLVFLKQTEKSNEAVQPSYISILKDRSFLLYLIPWFLFLMVSTVVLSINEVQLKAGEAYNLGILENALAGIFAVVFGVFSDKVGRKRLAILGFILVGLGYASLAVAPPGYILTLGFYTLVDGIAWGAFYTIFLLTIWGDLANGRGSEKYYVLGSLPYLLTNFLQFFILNVWGKGLADYVTLFSYASLFLFLAVLPLVYAPETLPEKALKDRDLKSYVQKAQKLIEKENFKTQRKTQVESQKCLEPDKEVNDEDEKTVEVEINIDCDDEACKLAEKYY